MTLKEFEAQDVLWLVCNENCTCEFRKLDNEFCWLVAFHIKTFNKNEVQHFISPCQYVTGVEAYYSYKNLLLASK